MATYKKTSIEGAQEKVLFEEVLKEKKKELGEAYENYKKYTTQQELLEEAARINLIQIPDPKSQQPKPSTNPKNWNWTAIITWSIILTVATSLINLIYNLIF
jgi:hypothetical protein